MELAGQHVHRKGLSTSEKREIKDHIKSEKKGPERGSGADSTLSTNLTDRHYKEYRFESKCPVYRALGLSEINDTGKTGH